MKKNIKRLMALVVAMVMAIAMMSVSAFATDTGTTTPTHTITINKATNDTANHSYEAYKIFAGKLETVNNKKVLSDITWGNGIDQTKLGTLASDLNALRDSTAEGYVALTKDSKASDFAKALSDLNATDDGATAQKVAAAFGKVLSTITSGTGSNNGVSGLDDGYYFIKDKDNSLADAEKGAYTRYILQVLGSDVTINEKADVPTVTKTVDDVNDSTGNAETAKKTADHDIGDDVPFTLTATTASKVSDYVKYHVTFEDTQSAGLDAPESFKVAVLGKELNLTNTIGQSATATTNKGTVIKAEVISAEEGKTFAIKVSFENSTAGTKIDAEANSTAIVVTYTSKLNQEAVIGNPGNPNDVYLRFSNNPNNKDDNEEGKTPEDHVVVFTYKLTADKVDESNNALKGAGFKLYKKIKDADGADDTWQQIGNEVTGPEMTEFSWVGLDDGDYKLEESTVPVGYNKMEDLEFTITATHGTTLTNLTASGTTFSAQKIEDGDLQGSLNGELKGNIENKKGSTLPSTGGIGTTIFYVLGAILVAGAAIVLVARKRSQAE